MMKQEERARSWERRIMAGQKQNNKEGEKKRIKSIIKRGKSSTGLKEERQEKRERGNRGYKFRKRKQ